jgi:hypothetical protein
MKTLLAVGGLIACLGIAHAEDEPAPSRIDSITKSARDMMPAMPSMPSISLPSMPDLSLPDFSDTTGRLMTEFNTFTQQVGDALPILEQMGYEVTTFKVTWGLPPKARLRLKSTGNVEIQKVNAIAARAFPGKIESGGYFHAGANMIQASCWEEASMGCRSHTRKTCAPV